MSVEHDAVAKMVQDFEAGAVVTKFVVVAEVINTDGECGVWTTTHEGAKSWDVAGLLVYALEDRGDG